MSKVTTYFQKLRKAIDLEYESELAEFQEKIKNNDLKERISDGMSLYPMVLNNSSFSYGGQLILEFEHTKERIQRGRFRNGTLVEIFDTEENTIEGIIKGYVKGTKIKAIIKADSVPDWLEKGKIGFNLMPDTKTYKVIKWALDKVEEAKTNERSARIRDVIIGEKSASYKEDSLNEAAISDKLNESQKQAVKNSTFDKEITLLHGPPGTGKTTTIVEIIKQSLKEKKKILVTAPSNMAVDWLSEKLINEKVNVLRLGNPVRVSEAVTQNTLEEKINNHPEAKLIKKWRADYLKAIRKAKQHKRSFDEAARAERKSLFAEARDLKESIWATEKQIIDQLISGADVVSCTLTGAGDYILNGYDFDLAIVDEAGQALEPLTWIATLKAEKILLAGDPYQLPATVKNKEAKKLGLEKSLLEKCIKNDFNNLFLDTQYRMNEQIMKFSNDYFYNSQLKAHASNADHNLSDIPVFTFVDTAGTGMNEKVSESRGKSNEEEAKLLVDFMKLQLIMLPEAAQSEVSIGVLSPYSDQVEILKELIAADEDLKPYTGLVVNTIDSFQGQEKDAIFISLVRSNENGEIGFLKDYRRMNVAMTRAKKSLSIIGDSATIANDTFYSKIIDYAESINAYKSAWEFKY